jgi:putative hydrolase of the HAD superfamily
MQIKAILFDLDNTLCNTTKALEPSFNTCYKFLLNYYPKINKARFNSLQETIFDTLTRQQKIPLYSSQALFWHEMFDKLELKYDPAIFEDLIYLLNDELAKNVDLFPGIEKMLKDLKKLGLMLGILSNGAYIDKAMRYEFLNLKRYIDILVSTDLVRRDKPSPRAFKYIIEKLHVKPEETVFIGDEMEADIKGAKGVGMIAIYNKWNDQKLNHTDKSIKPDYVVTKPEQVIDIIKKLIKK